MEAAVAGDERLVEQWKLLRAAATRAKQANNNNGVLIRTRMDYNRRALAALQVAPAKSGFYGPDGRVPGVLEGLRWRLGSVFVSMRLGFQELVFLAVCLLCPCPGRDLLSLHKVLRWRLGSVFV